MRIDAHQHFWDISRGDYGWLTPDLGPIYRDFGPHDLSPLLRAHGIGGTILVQAAPTEAETLYLLGIAAGCDTVLGVVGWTDFEAPDVPARIAALAANPHLVGLRPMVQDLADDTWLSRSDLDVAFAAMIAQDLTFDALVLPRHLVPLLARMRRHPDLRVVIDHAAKPVVNGTLPGDWAADIATLARETTAMCKISGLVTEAGPDWTVAMLRPVVDHLLDVFGPGRLLWGSDWPVCTLAARYGDWDEATAVLLRGVDAESRDAILGGNARRLYLERRPG
jgi:L-fuconolactonase